MLAGTDGGKAELDLAGGFIDGGSNATDFIRRSIIDASAQIAALDASGDINDVLQAARGPHRGGSRDQQGDEGREERSPEKMVADLGLHGFDIGERIGEADGSSGDGSRDVEEGYADGGAAALALASLPLECRYEFFSVGVVLHVVGIGLRIGEHSAGGVDNGGASSGGLTFLGGDLGEGMGFIGFDAVSEQESLLGQIALDFGAQGGFPSVADDDVEDGGSGGNDDEKNGEQLEEDAVLQSFLG